MAAAKLSDRRPLTERYRPDRLSGVVGNARAVDALRRWADGWEVGAAPPRLRAALLEGAPGLGKTSAAWALARERGWSVVEMNASEARNKGAIEAVAGRASLSGGFTDDGQFRRVREGGRTLILLDEADCLSGRAVEGAAKKTPKRPLRDFLQTRYGTTAALAAAWGLGAAGAPPAFESWNEVPLTGGRGAWTRLAPAKRDLADWEDAGSSSDLSDRGGLGAIAALVRTTRQPVAITVNDPAPLTRYSPLFRTGVVRVRFTPVPAVELRRRLEEIIAAEHLAVGAETLDAIVGRSGGDLRAALTDVEAVAPLPTGALQLSVLSGRDRSTELEQFVSQALSAPRWRRSVEIRNEIDAPPDDLLPWVEENAPHATRDPIRRLDALETVARAERLLALARRSRHFGLWSYASEILTGGVSIALDRPRGSMPLHARFPSFLGQMGQMRVSRALRQGLLRKLGRAVHSSRRRANSEYLALYFLMFEPGTPNFDKDSGARFRRLTIRELALTPEELGYLLGSPPDGPEVAREWSAAEAEPEEPTVAPEKPKRAKKSAPKGEVEVPPQPAAPKAPEPEAASKRKRSQKKLAEF
ncbi:MAG: AAA family ATPase [Thermoplasmata archaeon]|nr:AAA family ATPase [Thermoplasmata archaeon]